MGRWVGYAFDRMYVCAVVRLGLRTIEESTPNYVPFFWRGGRSRTMVYSSALAFISFLEILNYSSRE